MYNIDIFDKSTTLFERTPGYVGVKGEDGLFYRVYNTNGDDSVILSKTEFSIWATIDEAQDHFWGQNDIRDVVLSLSSKNVIRHYHGKRREQKPPIITTTENKQLGYVDMRVTTKCNFKCSYCCIDSSPDSGSFMSEEFFFKIANQLDQMGVQEVYLSGGEPFLHPKIMDFIRHLRDRHLISMVTNGTFITAEIAKELADIDIPYLSVSLDGHNEETNAPTRGKGNFGETLAGIKNLLKYEVRFALVCTLTSDNKEQIERYLDFASSLGVKKIGFNYLSHIGRANDSLHLFLSEQELSNIKLKTEKWQKNSGIDIDLLHIDCRYKKSVKQQLEEKVIPAEGFTTMLPCRAGETTLGILPNGDVVPCPALFSYNVGNVNEQSLLELLTGSEPLERLRDLREQPTSVIEFCAGCEYVAKCTGGCRGTAYEFFGDLKAPNPSCPVVGEVLDELQNEYASRK